MKIVVVPRHRPAFFAIGVALLSLLALFYVGLFIIMNAKPSAAGATECTWTGAGVNDNWSTAANWTCDEGTVPEDGTALTFPYNLGTGYTAPLNNDLTATNVYTGILFTGTCATTTPTPYTPYTINGNDVRIAGDIIAELSSHPGATVYDCVPDFGADILMVSNGTIDRITSAADINVGTYDVLLENVTTATLSGSGDITTEGSILFYGDSSAFTGTITITSGQAWMYNINSFGASSVPITIGSGGVLSYSSFVTGPIPNPITVTSGAQTPALTTGNQMGDSYTQDEIYAKDCSPSGGCGARPHDAMTFSGTITLQKDMAVEVPYGAITFTGTINGNGHGIVLYNPNDPNDGSMNDLIINSGTNNSTSANGSYNPTRFVTTIANSNSDTLLIGVMNKVVVNGERGDITLVRGGILSGSGKVGTIEVETGGGVIQPGNSPETLDTGSITLSGESSVDIELGGTTAGQFDQLNVTGTVSLSDATLNVIHWDDYVPVNGDSFIIINNDSSDAISGTFAGLAEGAEVVVDEVTYTISYVGGTGNDVVLTTLDSPGPPDTAGVFGVPTSLLLPVGIIFTALAALLLRRQFKKLHPATVRNK